MNNLQLKLFDRARLPVRIKRHNKRHNKRGYFEGYRSNDRNGYQKGTGLKLCVSILTGTKIDR